MAMANEATNQHLPLPALRQLRGAPFAARLTGLLALTLVGMLAGARTAHAVETTDVLDAFDDDNGDPFDMALRVRFQNESRTATIGRESRCLVGDAIGNGLCGSSGNVYAREMKYQRSKNTMFVDARFGLYKDLEFSVTFPFVTSDKWQHDFVDGVDRTNSTIFSAKDSEVLFKAPYNSAARSGFGDMVFGLKWSPYNYYRDATHPTWVFGVDLKIPSGQAMKVGNTGVGEGFYDIGLYSTISRRALQIFEPFFNLHGNFRFGAESGLFKNYGATQGRDVDPGNQIGSQFGLTVVPWEDIKEDKRFEIEGGFGMDYIFRGREYTEIWEALASADNPCQAATGCVNTLHSRSDPGADGKLTQTDGITTVEPYGRFAGWAAVHYQPIKYFQISAKVGWMRETAHFLTFADPGVDLDGKNGVEVKNSNNTNEFSPVYLPSVDTIGQRIRLLDASNTLLMISVSGKY